MGTILSWPRYGDSAINIAIPGTPLCVTNKQKKIHFYSLRKMHFLRSFNYGRDMTSTVYKYDWSYMPCWLVKHWLLPGDIEIQLGVKNRMCKERSCLFKSCTTLVFITCSFSVEIDVKTVIYLSLPLLHGIFRDNEVLQIPWLLGSPSHQSAWYWLWIRNRTTCHIVTHDGDTLSLRK